MKKLFLVLVVLFVTTTAFAKPYSRDVNFSLGYSFTVDSPNDAVIHQALFDIDTIRLWKLNDLFLLGYAFSFNIDSLGMGLLIGPTVGIKCNEIVDLDLSAKFGLYISSDWPAPFETELRAKFLPNKFVSPIGAYSISFANGLCTNKFHAGVALGWK